MHEALEVFYIIFISPADNYQQESINCHRMFSVCATITTLPEMCGLYRVNKLAHNYKKGPTQPTELKQSSAHSCNYKW